MANFSKRGVFQFSKASHPRSAVAEFKFNLAPNSADLVHLDVVAVEVEARDPVLDVRLPPHGLRPEVEELDVPVVVAGGQASVLVRVGVAEGDGPAIPRCLKKTEDERRGGQTRASTRRSA